jgi:hypothetical protein
MAGLRTLAVLVLTIACCGHCVEAVTTKIPPASEECFHDWAPAGSTINVAFAVTHGGKLDVDSRVSVSFWSDNAHQTMTQQIKTWQGVMEGHTEFVAPLNVGHKPTKMEICISNKMARWTPKWVNIEFYKLLPAADDGLTGEHNSRYREVEDKLHDYARIVYEMRTKMTKVRATEDEHRTMVESTNSWIFYGSLTNGVLLALMAGFQFWYLKNFLAVRASVMRM